MCGSWHSVVRTQLDVERARRAAVALATRLGFAVAESEAVVLAVSELGTNLVRYAAGGELRVCVVEQAGRVAIKVESHDTGPGIADLDRALEDGYSTGGGLGSGLPAVRRLMDDFSLSSSPQGTQVVAHKWQRRAS